MALRGSLLGNIFFWLVLAGASAAAFGAGFWYTFGMTVNVNTKSPVAEPTAAILAANNRPTPTPRPTPSPSPSAGLIGASVSPLPTHAASTPTPDPILNGMQTPVPVRSGTPEPLHTPPPAAPGKEEIYRVQVGSFPSRETAQKQVEELQTVGINAVVVYDGGAYRAQLGAFGDRARAISVADEVNTRGYSVTIRH